jgi:hypothetical protein
LDLRAETNLALRYGHRTSIDIDLFSPFIIGIKGLDDFQAGDQQLQII